MLYAVYAHVAPLGAPKMWNVTCFEQLRAALIAAQLLRADGLTVFVRIILL